MTTDQNGFRLDRREFLGGVAAVGTAVALPGGTSNRPSRLATTFRKPGSRFRPRVTWWWPGPAVEDAELRAEIAELVHAGFGGAQIFETPGLGLPADRQPPERFLWGTPHWVGRIETALRAAKDHDFRIDLQVSSGWPWNSPAVSGEHADLAQQQLVFGHQELVGPARIDGIPPRPDGVDPDARLVAAVAGRLASASTVDPDSTVDLTPTLDSDGAVHGKVPAGRWVLLGFWQVPTGQRSNDSSSPDDPLVLDHLHARATRAATADLERRLLDQVGPLAAQVVDRVHEDSPALPFTGLLWTGQFLDEFKARRGYDLTRHLAALAVVDYHSFGQVAGKQVYDLSGNAGHRVRHDYNQTLTELWIDHHIRPARRWARRHGLDFQGRGHGLSMDVVAVNKAYAAPDADPFDGPIGFTRTLTSGGRLAGNDVASHELGTMLSRDYMVTLEALKHLADKAFVGGANEQVLHGYPYKRAHGAGWPSWWPWSSEHDVVGHDFGVSEGVTPAIPWWRHLRPLADYLARAQTVLRAGRPVTDVALYRDVQGYGRVVDPHIDEHGEPLLDVALAGTGYSFDIVDPGALAQPTTTVRDRRLLVRPPGYRALVVELAASTRQGLVDCGDAMSASVARRLVSFARDGLPIVFVGRFPQRGVGYGTPEHEDAAVREAVAELRRSPRVRLVRDEAGVVAALEQLEVRPDVSFDRVQPVRSVHRRTPTGDYWFLSNVSGTLDDSVRLVGGMTTRFTAEFLIGDKAPDRWDLWTGEIQPVGHFRRAGGRVAVPLALAPGESVVVGFERPARAYVVDTTAERVVVRAGKLHLRSTTPGVVTAQLADGRTARANVDALPQPLEPARWTLYVTGAVPEGEERHTVHLERLADWRDLPKLRHTSGTGTYRTTITLDERWTEDGRGAYLELGRVDGGVELRVNDQRAHPASVPPPRIDISAFLRTGRNVLEVEVTTTLKNRLTALAEQGVSGYSRFLERPVRTQPYGLIGPVRLIPYAEISIS